MKRGDEILLIAKTNIFSWVSQVNVCCSFQMDRLLSTLTFIRQHWESPFAPKVAPGLASWASHDSSVIQLHGDMTVL